MEGDSESGCAQVILLNARDLALAKLLDTLADEIALLGPDDRGVSDERHDRLIAYAREQAKALRKE